MKRIFLVIVLILCAPNTFAQDNITRFFVSFGFETLSVGTVSSTFTRATIEPPGAAYRANMIEFSIEGCPIRYRIGATAPTATVGVLMLEGNGKMFGWDNIRDIKFIRDTSCTANATLSTQIYR